MTPFKENKIYWLYTKPTLSLSIAPFFFSFSLCSPCFTLHSLSFVLQISPPWWRCMMFSLVNVVVHTFLLKNILVFLLSLWLSWSRRKRMEKTTRKRNETTNKEFRYTRHLKTTILNKQVCISARSVVLKKWTKQILEIDSVCCNGRVRRVGCKSRVLWVEKHTHTHKSRQTRQDIWRYAQLSTQERRRLLQNNIHSGRSTCFFLKNHHCETNERTKRDPRIFYR